MAQHKVLVVDDDAKFLRFITEVLIGAGYDVRGIADPLMVIPLAEEFRPDLVILDITMPAKDGIQVAEDLKARGIPRMFLTGMPANQGMRAAREAGGMAYLEKPVASSRLLWAVKALLGI